MADVKLVNTIPLFPLYGAILLPGAILPIHIHERRYRQMVEYALEEELLIGMIQPASQDTETLCKVGCAGNIEQKQKLPKGHYLIQLHGQSRFHIVEELESETLFRQAKVDYSAFPNDTKETVFSKSPERLYQNFRDYSEKKNLKIEWEKIEAIPLRYLVNLLSMNLDFSGIEKQTLLESPDLDSRLDDLNALMEMITPAGFPADISPNFLN